LADLVTHACVALLWKAASRRPHIASFVAGTLLPDLLCRLPGIGFTALSHRDVDVPWVLLVGWEPLHLPIGMALASYALALLFSADVRRGVFANLLGGMFLHLGMDMLQSHQGIGYLLAFPLPSRSVELGWIGSEATVWIALPLALVTGLVWKRKMMGPGVNQRTPGAGSAEQEE